MMPRMLPKGSTTEAVMYPFVGGFCTLLRAMRYTLGRCFLSLCVREDRFHGETTRTAYGIFRGATSGGMKREEEVRDGDANPNRAGARRSGGRSDGFRDPGGTVSA